MESLSETTETKRRYSDLLSNLTESLPCLADQVDGLADRMLPGLCPRDQLDWLDVLAGETITRESEVLLLAAAGDQLIAILTELDCQDAPKVRQIQMEVDGVRKHLADIVKAIDVKRVALNAALAELMAANAGLTAALGWLNDAEGRSATMISRGISLSVPRLSDQITEIRAFAAEVAAYAPNVGTVAERCASVWIVERVSELQDRHNSLVRSLDEHDSRLDDVRRRLTGVLEGVATLDRWIAGTVGTVGRQSVDLEELCATRQSRRRELDNLTAVGRELTSDSSTTDKHFLRDALSDLRARWRELMQLLTDTVSNAATAELDKLNQFMSESSGRVTDSQPVSCDADSIMQQLTTYKSFHEELYSKRESIDRTLSRCRRMLHESPTDEDTSIDVDVRLTALREQINDLCLLSDRRLLKLQELVPLVSHMSQMTHELHDWLSDIDGDVTALDSDPGDLTPDTDDHAEQLRLRRFNVKSTLQLLDERQSDMDELAATAQEIVTLCADTFSATPIIQQVTDVTKSYTERRQIVHRRLDDLEALFHQIFTDVSNELCKPIACACIVFIHSPTAWASQFNFSEQAESVPVSCWAVCRARDSFSGRQRARQCPRLYVTAGRS